TLPASEAVTAVTDYSSSGPLFFGRRVMFNRQPPTTALSKKLHSLPSSIRRIIQTRGHSCVDPGPSRRAANSVMRRNRRTQPSRQRTYIRLYARVDRLEDAISHFYNVINELRRRVSTLEKKSKPLAKR